MFFRRRPLTDLHDRGPLRVMFVITSMPVGGAETLLVELVRRLDRSRFLPELCCLKDLGPLGEMLALEIPTHFGLLTRKTDMSVLWRLAGLMRRRRIDAVVTVGAGDKMFWGRLAARLAGVPVIASALHSTGWPDRVQFANRLLAPITDAFIAVAEPHGRYLAAHEGCTAAKIHVIPNGVDVERFRPRPPNALLRNEFGLAADAPVAGIVAALRPEKNHSLFLRAAARVRQAMPEARFLIVGDGPAARRVGGPCPVALDRGRRPLPGHAERRAGSAFPDRRAGPEFAHRGQSGVDPGSDGRREAGRGHAGRFGRQSRA